MLVKYFQESEQDEKESILQGFALLFVYFPQSCKNFWARAKRSSKQSLRDNWFKVLVMRKSDNYC